MHETSPGLLGRGYFRNLDRFWKAKARLGLSSLISPAQPGVAGGSSRMSGLTQANAKGTTKTFSLLLGVTKYF